MARASGHIRAAAPRPSTAFATGQAVLDSVACARDACAMRFFRTPAWLAAGTLGLLHVPADAGDVDVVYVDSFEAGCGNLLYAEPFAQGDGSAWPSPWSVLGNVALQDVQQSRARLMPSPTNYSLARMGGAVSTGNVEVRFTLRFEDLTTQGVGFYVRQNGGYLGLTTPHGQGYAVFAEASFRGLPGVGVWKEIDGVEMQIAHSAPPSPALAANTDYRVRYQVLQVNPTQTLSRAKFWPAADAEPVAWQISMLDASAVLQNISGGIAIDSWSNIQTPGTITAHTLVDDVELVSLCAP